jgi:peptidoglycan/LPS O-acetylase OafA/YrhL
LTTATTEVELKSPDSTVDSALSVQRSACDVAAKSKAASFYRPELDLIRFVGFTMVCLGHLFWGNSVEHLSGHLPHWVARFIMACADGAAYSVDSFFLLSAYLITELLLRERETTGALNTRAFYARRILRVWPLYFLYIALAALVPFLNPVHDFDAKYIVAFILMFGNWSLIAWGWPNSFACHL